MKKILKFKYSLIVSLVLFLNGLPTAFAEPLSSGEIQGKLDMLLPKEAGNGARGDGQVIPLPTDNLKTEIVPKLIKIALQLSGTLAFCVFIYAGIMLIIAQGNEEEITKFKKILIWSAVGTAFIAGAYALVNGLMQINFM